VGTPGRMEDLLQEGALSLKVHGCMAGRGRAGTSRAARSASRELQLQGSCFVHGMPLICTLL
jgi:hypothetical protein